MKHFTRTASLVLLFWLCILSSANIEAQSNINLERDTISNAAANNSRNKFKSDIGNSKKTTSVITFDVGQLGDIIDACKAKGIASVQFVIATIQPQDVAHYSNHHKGLSPSDKSDIIGRQTVLVRVPREAFGDMMQGSAGISPNNSLMISMLTSGFIYLNKPYSSITASGDYMYFEIGTICPPPGVCD